MYNVAVGDMDLTLIFCGTIVVTIKVVIRTIYYFR